MSQMKTSLIAVAMIFVFAQRAAPVAACNVCHSKNPKMVKMHKDFEMKDCFKCHMPGQKKSPDELKVQMTNDPLCTGCHKK